MRCSPYDDAQMLTETTQQFDISWNMRGIFWEKHTYSTLSKLWSNKNYFRELNIKKAYIFLFWIIRGKATITSPYILFKDKHSFSSVHKTVNWGSIIELKRHLNYVLIQFYKKTKKQQLGEKVRFYSYISATFHLFNPERNGLWKHCKSFHKRYWVYFQLEIKLTSCFMKIMKISSH